MECYECGNDAVRPRQQGDRTVYECTFCGALDGDASAVGEAFIDREAAERAVDRDVFPLVRVLERIPGFHARDASGGSPAELIPPYVSVYIEDADGALRQLEHLLQSLEMSHRKTNWVWAIEAHYDHAELRFTMRPRFMKPVRELTADEITQAQSDLRTLASRIDRDLALSWWTAR